MKRFVLLNSPIFYDSREENEQYLPPLGLGYIATYLEMAQLDVEIIDCVKENKSVIEIIDNINNSKPTYVGINVFTQNYDLVKQIVEGIDFSCECFIGGQAVKSIYHKILQWNVKNRLNIIIGEGELIIPHIVLKTCVQQPLEQKELKYVYKVDKDSLYYPNDISDIILDRKCISNEIICNHYGDNEVAIVTSRGCVFNCAFCGGARSLNEDVTIRVRTQESIVAEIKEIISLYPTVQSIRILDDLFLRNTESIDMANNIFAQFPGLKWRGMAHVVPLLKNVDKIKDLKIGGCKELFIGIESGSELIRKKINKLGSVDDIIYVAKEILKNGIDLKGYFIYGFPQENETDFKKTYELAIKLKEISKNELGNFRASVFQFRPYDGTQLYNEIVSNSGIIHGCKASEVINCFDGRVQFNFDFGNYSCESDELLYKYIIQTQKLTEEE